MTTETFLLILLIVLLIGALPRWPYSQSWGYTPTGLFSLVLVILVILMIVGSRQTNNVGEDIKRGAREAGQNIKDIGQDIKDSVRDHAR